MQLGIIRDHDDLQFLMVDIHVNHGLVAAPLALCVYERTLARAVQAFGRLNGQILSLALNQLAKLNLCRPDPNAPSQLGEIASSLLHALFFEP